MKKKDILKKVSLFVTVSFLLAGCGKYIQNRKTADFKISLADAKWDGKKIPAGEQCSKFGGKASTPRLLITNIPAEANAIIMEYSDKDHKPMDNGGHGKIGYKIKPGISEVTIPSVPGHTFKLPKGFFLVTAHSNPKWDKAGAYMPPCSGGKGNRYYVTVKAVQVAEGKEAKVLAEGMIQLGKY
ncbi:MAG: hypothetical protein ABIJ24_02695 [Nitrospinota bacterium]|nr:hypothetical protein [Nitrospinota bacterium]